MKRREVVMGLSALAAMPALLSLSADTVAQSLVSHETYTAKRGGSSQMFRLDMKALQFSSSAASVNIDALCDAGGKLLPYRIASFSAGAVSPQSRLFGFAMDQRALAGFRVEMCRAGRPSSTGSTNNSCLAGVESPYVSAQSGLYVLDVDRTGMGVVVSPLRPNQRLDDAGWLASRYDQTYMVFSISPVT
ncbi:MAG: hypothetical protein SGI99_08635 [Pseudomonadota bacterium]|nr:hypothetical protein [Pseudomonadota bacterium]